jgi:hypothetical protein
MPVGRSRRYPLELRERATLNAGDQPPAEIPYQKVSGHAGGSRYSFEPIECLNLVASWLEIYAGGFLPRADMLNPVDSIERYGQRLNTLVAKLDSYTAFSF